MNELINFVDSGILFKCDPIEFNDKIRNVLTDIFVYNPARVRFDGIYNHARERFENTHDPVYERFEEIYKLRCIICWQIVFDDSFFVICNDCCRTCINKNILISVSRNVYVCHKLRNNYWGNIDEHVALRLIRKSVYDDDNYDDKCSLLKYFINSSHKLIHRFYHVVSPSQKTSVS